MLRVFSTFGLLTILFSVGPWLETIAPEASALILVTLAVGLASVIGGAATPVATASGALGALASVALSPLSVVAALAALALGVWAPRALRTRGGWRGLLVQAAVVASSTAVAAWLVAFHEFAGLGVRTIAVVIAVIVASAPWLLVVDDRLAVALAALSRQSRGTTRWRLDRAATLRREIVRQRARRSQPQAEHRRLDAAFRALINLGQTRIGKPEGEAMALDDAIAEHLAVLEESARAMAAREVAVAGARRDAAESLREESVIIAAEAEAYGATAPPSGVE